MTDDRRRTYRFNVLLSISHVWSQYTSKSSHQIDGRPHVLPFSSGWFWVCFFVYFRNWEKCILRILLRYFISLDNLHYQTIWMKSPTWNKIISTKGWDLHFVVHPCSPNMSVNHMEPSSVLPLSSKLPQHVCDVLQWRCPPGKHRWWKRWSADTSKGHIADVQKQPSKAIIVHVCIYIYIYIFIIHYIPHSID